ncbi:acyl-CoA N-acyltransferase [Mycena floridula]|nr:acyl-CoA N-acyltransferase [Mycena floridula]
MWDYCQACLQEDLKDIPRHYKLAPKVDKLVVNREIPLSQNDDLQPMTASGFWVAEMGSRVVGMVALDQASDKPEVELRRMSVLASYRGRGIASQLIKTIVDHATKHKMTSIFLSTSTMQPGAIAMYKKYGWSYKQILEVFRVAGMDVQVITYERLL